MCVPRAPVLISCYFVQGNVPAMVGHPPVMKAAAKDSGLQSNDIACV